MEIAYLKGLRPRAILWGVFTRAFLSTFFGIFVIALVGIGHVVLFGKNAEPISRVTQLNMLFFIDAFANVIAGVVTYKHAKDSPMPNLVAVGILWTIRSMLIWNPSVAENPSWLDSIAIILILPFVYFGGWLAQKWQDIHLTGLPPVFYRTAFLLLMNIICAVRFLEFMDLFINKVDPESVSTYSHLPSGSFIPAVLAWIPLCVLFWVKGFRGIRFRKTILFFGLLFSQWPLLVIVGFFLAHNHEDPALLNFVVHLAGSRG